VRRPRDRQRTRIDHAVDDFRNGRAITRSSERPIMERRTRGEHMLVKNERHDDRGLNLYDCSCRITPRFTSCTLELSMSRTTDLPPDRIGAPGVHANDRQTFVVKSVAKQLNGPVSIPARARSGGFFVSQVTITSGQLEIFLSATIRSASLAAPFAFLRDIDCCMAGHGVFPSIAERRLVLDTISLRTANLDARGAPRDCAK
jgi:hypothetical protein